jgi:hypothetical protein
MVVVACFFALSCPASGWGICTIVLYYGKHNCKMKIAVQDLIGLDGIVYIEQHPSALYVYAVFPAAADGQPA